MKRKFYWTALLTTLLVLALAGCQALAPEDDDATPTPQLPGVTPTPEEVPTPPAMPETGVEAIPPEYEEFAAEWPLPNKDYSNSRATFDSTIDSSSVTELGVAWSFPIRGIGLFGGAASNPIIANQVVYFQDLGSNVFALDLDSGEVLWEYEINQGAVGPNGVAIGYGKVYAQSGEEELHALDMDSGEELWFLTLDGPAGAHQPSVFNGLVLTGIQAGSLEVEGPEEGVSARGTTCIPTRCWRSTRSAASWSGITR